MGSRTAYINPSMSGRLITRRISAMSSGNESGKCTRRQLIFRAPVATVLATSMLTSQLMPTSEEVMKELSELAANIPGLGQADVFYPSFFKGEWKVERTLYFLDSTADKQFADDPVLGVEAVAALQERIGRTEEFRLRFYKHRGKIIEDRAFNMQNEVRVEFPNQCVAAKWSPDNPNVVTVSGSVSSGAQRNTGQVAREVKITKRAFKDEPGGRGTFFASEYARVVDIDDEGALLGVGKSPHISAWRRISRYQVYSVRDEDGVLVPDVMNRLTIDYRYPATKPENEAQLVLKYREFLTKVRS